MPKYKKAVLMHYGEVCGYIKGYAPETLKLTNVWRCEYLYCIKKVLKPIIVIRS